MCFCCYIVYNEQCNTRIFFSAYKSYILVYFDFLGPHPVDVFIQDFVFIGMVVIYAPYEYYYISLLSSWEQSLALYYFIQKIMKKSLKMFWLSYFDLTGIFIKNFYVLHFYIFFALIFYFVKDILGKKNKQYFLYCHFLLLFLFSSQLPYNVYIIEKVNISSSLFLIF